MIRFLAAGLLAAMLPQAGLAQTAPFDEAAIYENAKAEGELTWYVAQYVTEAAEEVANRFTAAYPGVKVNVIRASGSVIYSRLQQDLQAGVPQCDVFSSTELGHVTTLKEDEKLQPFRTANEDKLYPEFANLDPDGYYTRTTYQATILSYNTKLLSEVEAPKTWKELADPKWKQKLAFGHPGYSGTMSAWVSAMVAANGEDYIAQLAENQPLIGRSMSDPVSAVSLGERQVGTGALTVVLKAIADGNPMAMVIPQEGVLISAQPSAIPANAPHPNAALLFMNFLQSKELQEWAAETQYYPPINAEAKTPEDVPDPDSITVFGMTTDEVAEGVPAAIDLWRDYFAG